MPCASPRNFASRSASAHWPLQTTDWRVQYAFHNVTIARGERHVNLVGTYRRICGDVDLAAQSDHRRICTAASVYSCETYMAANERYGHRVIGAELSFQACLGCFLTCQLQHERIGANRDRDNIVWLEMKFLIQLNRGINCRVDDNPARKWLVGVGDDFVMLSQMLCESGIVMMSRGSGKISVYPFKRYVQNW